MIHEIDESLRRLVLRDAVNGSGVELSFEAPTKEWASRRNTPTINIYLYDIREDVERREVEYEEIRDEEGRVLERRPPPRRYTLSYLVTVWTQRPEDEHQVLSSLLAAFLQFDRLPQDVLSEQSRSLATIAEQAGKLEDLLPLLASIRASLAAIETLLRDLAQSRAGDPNSEAPSSRRKSTG